MILSQHLRIMPQGSSLALSSPFRRAIYQDDVVLSQGDHTLRYLICLIYALQGDHCMHYHSLWGGYLHSAFLWLFEPDPMREPHSMYPIFCEVDLCFSCSVRRIPYLLYSARWTSKRHHHSAPEYLKLASNCAHDKTHQTFSLKVW